MLPNNTPPCSCNIQPGSWGGSHRMNASCAEPDFVTWVESILALQLRSGVVLNVCAASDTQFSGLPTTGR